MLQQPSGHRPPPCSLKCLSRDSVQKSPHSCRPALHFFRAQAANYGAGKGLPYSESWWGVKGVSLTFPVHLGTGPDQGRITEPSQVNRTNKQTWHLQERAPQRAADKQPSSLPTSSILDALCLGSFLLFHIGLGDLKSLQLGMAPDNRVGTGLMGDLFLWAGLLAL